jgi:hypothetical protein
MVDFQAQNQLWVMADIHKKYCQSLYHRTVIDLHSNLLLKYSFTKFNFKINNLGNHLVNFQMDCWQNHSIDPYQRLKQQMNNIDQKKMFFLLTNLIDVEI